jgi:hypothetical protein
MARIVCGLFEDKATADAALQGLLGNGFSRSGIDSFATLPPGQNALHPLGGDVHSDAGARKAGGGGALGAAIGAAAGALVAFVASRMGLLPGDEWAIVSMVFGAGLGAYVGSFMGAMTKMRPGTSRNATREHPNEPPAGRMIAVLIEPPETDTRAIEQLKRHGARNVWRAEGTWRNGSWLDFDPRSRLVSV